MTDASAPMDSSLDQSNAGYKVKYSDVSKVSKVKYSDLIIGNLIFISTLTLSLRLAGSAAQPSGLSSDLRPRNLNTGALLT